MSSSIVCLKLIPWLFQLLTNTLLFHILNGNHFCQQILIVNSQSKIYITGKIIDDETAEPLPFATIALKNRGKGTVSNNNGDFGLKITPDLANDTLSISYLGYLGREIPVQKVFENNLTISMKKEFIPISEIIIKKSRTAGDNFHAHLKAILIIMVTHPH